MIHSLARGGAPGFGENPDVKAILCGMGISTPPPQPRGPHMERFLSEEFISTQNKYLFE